MTYDSVYRAVTFEYSDEEKLTTFDMYDRAIIYDGYISDYQINDVKVLADFWLVLRKLSKNSIKFAITPSWEIIISGDTKSDVDALKIDLENTINEKRLLKVKFIQLENSAMYNTIAFTPHVVHASLNNGIDHGDVLKLTVQLLKILTDSVFTTTFGTSTPFIGIFLFTYFKIDEETWRILMVSFSIIATIIAFAVSTIIKNRK